MADCTDTCSLVSSFRPEDLSEEFSGLTDVPPGTHAQKVS